MFDHDGQLLEEYGKTLPAMAALRDAQVGPHEKLILFCLMSRCRPVRDQGWTCWPSIASLARESGHSTSTVQAALKVLEGLGVLSRESGDFRTSNTYVLDYAAILALPAIPKRERKAREKRRG